MRQPLSRKIPTLPDYFSGVQIFLVNEGIEPYLFRKIRKVFCIFLTWNSDIVETENGCTIYYRQVLTSEFFDPKT